MPTDVTKASSPLLVLTACFYAVFTLLPDSHSLMVLWPWVFLWQVGLLCPVIWLLWLLWHKQRFPALGNGLDWCVGLTVLGIILSTGFADFPAHAFWYSWSAFGYIAALYALNAWLDRPQRRYQLLVAQGYLNLAFIVISLSLWTTQTLLPELARLEKLQQYGIQLSFNFSTLELRNWAPIGHQNYVAGYLLLALPLLVGLSIYQQGWRRWLWIAGVALGLVDLYTTSSRGGWLGLTVLCLASFGVLLLRSAVPRLWLGIGGVGALATVVLLGLANNRLRTAVGAVLSGQGGGELAYRMINVVIGWRMGSSQPLTGVGLGGVPLLYQHYRPIWAGRESELAYQLHSTPAHLWAEMGLWGIVPGVVAIALFGMLLWRWWQQPQPAPTEQIFIWSLYGSLLAYSAIALVDYQLDNVCISGTLVIYVAWLASAFRLPSTPSKNRMVRPLALVGLGIFVAAVVWLVPVHRAWQLSNQGFEALRQDEVETFVERLTRAHQLAPWEPYYSYQLGWNLGNLALQTADAQQQQQLLQQAIFWLETGTDISPNQEFGHSNLGWLLLSSNPQAAAAEFARSAQLVPAKRGVFYGLGLSLLAQGKGDSAVEALALEGLRNPLFITSPVWRSPQLQSVYPQVLARMEAKYTEFLQQDGELADWYRWRGGLYWWQGNLAAARAELQKSGTPLTHALLELAAGTTIEPQSQLPPSPSRSAIAAWLNPAQRSQLLEQAWVKATQTELPPPIEQALSDSMENSSSFEQWVKQNVPGLPYRYERTGFGVLSRHIDGPAPKDFWTVSDNVAMTQWFDELLPSPVYSPELDLALQPQREKLLQAVLGK